METEKKLYEVQVAGLPLKLRSSHDEETVGELARLVDAKVKEALSLGQHISFQNAILLSALHIAEDLVLLKRTAKRELGSLEKQAHQILSDLESSPVNRLGIDN